MTELPRLTRSMRAYTSLEPQRCLKLSTSEQVQEQLWRENQLKRGVSWGELKEFLKKEVDVSKLLLELWKIAQELAGCEQPSDVIDDAAIFILRLFLRESVVLLKHLAQLKKMFGQVPTEIANQICQLVGKISSMLSEQCLSYLETDTNNFKELPLWGSHIKCSLPTEYKLDTSSLKNLKAYNAVDSEVVTKFSMKYESKNNKASSSNKDNKILYGKVWLEKQLSTTSSNKLGLTAEECSDSIITMLQSSRSNDELQNELFDFLGFDRFELIQILLEKRKSIINNIANETDAKKYSSYSRNGTASLTTERKPVLGPQVVVQSEEEKLMMKQVRKEEKKFKEEMTKRNKNRDDSDSEPEFNPTELRNKRQAALKVAAPTILTKKSVATPKVVYPNVYDSQSEAKARAGVFSGGKVLLPEGVDRIDNKMYEEVAIPVNPKAPDEVGSVLVPISSLDEVGKIAFQGIKTLNRIQSVVFNAAYNTNENLLICAPTGAGKTNVAMLTIVHQIRQHMEQNVIKKDQFKIVYVAPMKALAAEMASGFSHRLSRLGISVRELTGDMQLTKSEMMETQMLITTPEKWDVVTRKATGDVSLATLVKLLIIDEVHLLHGDRGPVVEALVARTLRLVESSQSMIRIVGLSATLPNYIDVARFLRVSPYIGLFYFDSRFRPVPLSQTFIGVKALKPLQQMADMDTICFDKCLDMVQKGHQVMVFVHARNATVRTATVLKETAQQKGVLKAFETTPSPGYSQALRVISKSRNKQLGELFPHGFATHHAGMLRSDRSLVEKYFAEGYIKVLVCTSTLAWGVNLPAHAVIIRGTEIYNAEHGTFMDLGILDVLQIFGRAGRPQFDQSGTGIIITSHSKLSHYLSLLTNQFPIESNFVSCLADNLNAEIVLGTISNIEEAIEWLSYTYLFVRMRINPQVYGINYQDVLEDPTLDRKRREIIETAANALDRACMIRFNPRTNDLSATDLGRTASHFYIKYDTVEVFNELMQPIMSEGEVLSMISQAQEFQQLKVRDDEMQELDDLTQDNCFLPVPGGSENLHGKVNILMQTYLSRGTVKSFSLLSDLSYITQNAVRISRALFEIVLHRNNPLMSGRLLTLSIMLELRLWDYMNPLNQFTCIPQEVLSKIENRRLTIDRIRDMETKEIGEIVRHLKMGQLVKKCADEFPLLEMSATLQPITRTVLRIRLQITANFRWNDKVHGKFAETFWLWVEDPESNYMYHSEYFKITRKQVINAEPQELVMTIPLIEPLPPQYFIRATSDRWLGSVNYLTLSFQHLILPEIHPPHTDLLVLEPLPISALDDKNFEALYNFTHFNPIQTQIFHCLYHTDNNVLLGAPTGSGKTIVAEIAMCRVFKKYPQSKVVYIAPLKALVRERIQDWKVRMEQKLGKKVVELTGDVTPDTRAIAAAHIIVTTPEKWDGISRSWQTRSYVRSVALIIIDEIHLLGEDRGPVLEVIVSRTNFIASHTERSLRVIGLSTALANARDLANWLGIGQMGLYNFRPSVRPVPLEVHIAGFPGKHYCPRMASMNRTTFQSIRQHSPESPALVFVSSRRQTRLTALDLIAFLASEEDPKQWLHMDENALEQVLSGVKDQNLKLCLAFGVGMHHAGLQERDRNVVEELFVNQKIQVLIATATLAWGVNFPAHLVVVKGTEYFDGKQKRYVDMPITDVLQMMGRAGRPQFDNQGVAVVLVHDIKKNFYKKFLYEPFPVESSLLQVLPDHINAEIVAGTVTSKQDVLDYLTWTYFFRRLLQNPAYYQLQSLEPAELNYYLTNLVETALDDLINAHCVMIDDDSRTLHATSFGRISSYYYLSHQTMMHFAESLHADLTTDDLMKILSQAYEYNELPVRHNEEHYNADLAKYCPVAVDSMQLDNPHVKAHLLLQAHLTHAPLPCTDYLTDTKSVLEQAIRILQAMTDICAERGWLASALGCQQVLQMLIQGRWLKDNALSTLPHIEPHLVHLFNKIGKYCNTLPGVKDCVSKRDGYDKLARCLREEFEEQQIEQIHKVLREMPSLDITLRVEGTSEGNVLDVKVKQPPSKDEWIQLNTNQEYTLSINMHRLGRRGLVHCPHFPRSKDEGWSLILGCKDTRELYAIKRIANKREHSHHHLIFQTPDKPGRLILTVYIMSDSYLGLDQQYDIQLELTTEHFSLFSDKGLY